MFKSKKGQQQMLMAGIVGLVIIAILAAIALTVVSETKDGVGSTICEVRSDGFTTYNETSQACRNATGSEVTSVELGYLDNSSTGISKFTTFLPIIALVIVAVVVLGYVYLLKRG